jgi:hypothetical protein
MRWMQEAGFLWVVETRRVYEAQLNVKHFWKLEQPRWDYTFKSSFQTLKTPSELKQAPCLGGQLQYL